VAVKSFQTGSRQCACPKYHASTMAPRPSWWVRVEYRTLARSRKAGWLIVGTLLSLGRKLQTSHGNPRRPGVFAMLLIASRSMSLKE